MRGFQETSKISNISKISKISQIPKMFRKFQITFLVRYLIEVLESINNVCGCIHYHLKEFKKPMYLNKIKSST